MFSVRSPLQAATPGSVATSRRLHDRFRLGRPILALTNHGDRRFGTLCAVVLLCGRVCPAVSDVDIVDAAEKEKEGEKERKKHDELFIAVIQHEYVRALVPRRPNMKPLAIISTV